MQRSECDKLFKRLYDLAATQEYNKAESIEYAQLLTKSKQCDHIFPLRNARTNWRSFILYCTDSVPEKYWTNTYDVIKYNTYQHIVFTRASVRSAYKNAWKESAPNAFVRAWRSLYP